jgi:hypothetical protein
MLIVPFFILGIMYVFGELKMNRSITDAVDDLEDSYYKGVASTCFKRDRSQYRCCLSSVYAMQEVNAKAISHNEECGGQVDQLKCRGSFVWCEEK